MLDNAQKTITTIAAVGALALGGAAFANAASNSGSAASQSSSGSAAQAAPNGGPPPGPHRGANGKQEKPLTGDTADKVKAAALARVSGGTVERVETDVDHGSPYEAHVTKSDGTQVEVLVNKSFEVTAVNSMTR